MMIGTSSVGAPGRSGAALADCDPALFRQNFNKQSFLFRHRLADNPLFSIARLAETAQAMLDGGDLGRFVVFDASAFEAGTGFGAASQRDQLAETVHRLADGCTWLKLSSANEADPAYAEVLDQIIGDLSELTGHDLASEITWSSLTIFMASPRITTPYHIDHESNFLLQVQGEKDVCLFDQNDREVLSETEIEQFYAGNVEAAKYKPDLQARGTMYRLAPGDAVHHPPLAPHWVRNGAKTSVSLSIGFCMRSLDDRAKVYQVNGLLRRAGLLPKSPGLSDLHDRMKMAGLKFATRPNATTRGDILYSGINRVTAPLRLASRLRGSHRQGQ